MKIGFDLDNVVVNFFLSFLDFYNWKYNSNFSIRDITSFYIWEIGIGRTREEAVRFIDEFYESEYYDLIPFVEGAEDGLRSLEKDNELYFITSRFLRYREKTERFFRRYFPEHLDRLYFSEDFSNSNGKTKARVCVENGIEVYIEDHIKYAHACSRRGIPVLLLRTPWNEESWKDLRKHSKKTIIPVENWSEILDELDEFRRYRK